ncbi:glycosyltransferase family 4 protein [Clostridium sp. BL-8]|uniref:glycosyltransferase family 4 protein n=1 Tax=Clostridium sp. BL-8 TaxID=349938 RepID=UPI00098BF8E5|nr:glycosyltransferase family 4 protein [Clostridium sp. BL-8]OOM73840.1 D-inositol 3-phosphate glycosyltransferase [Clostridium sp. BL-8]
MKIAIVKPDYRIVGGFEIVVDRIIKGLKKYGHHVDYTKVDMLTKRFNIGNIKVPENVYNKNEEFFRYAGAIQEFEKLDLGNYDIVIATQPPSYAVRHPKTVVLFYHHLKLYYDLYDVYVETLSKNPELDKQTKETIRAIDSKYITNDKHYLAGSKHVAKRLMNFNNIDEKNINIFEAGINDNIYEFSGNVDFKSPICVGRHEFPKRPELFLHAMKYIPSIEGRLVGEGGKTEDLKRIDKYLQEAHQKNIKIEDNELWKKTVFNANKLKINDTIKSNVVFTGKVSEKELIKEYSNALCVVCPSYEEDYGLTAIEAMAFGKPVITCSDGGGYMEFIEDGKNGFIVEPTGEAIAEKIKYLNDNRDVLEVMSKNAYEFSRKYNWNITIEKLNEYLERI